MILSPKIIDKITQEYTTWEESQYAGKTKEERQKLGAFFTPPVLSIKMLEKFDDLSGNFLDPTVGAGGLIAAAVIAGADPRRCYGIELDPSTALICRDRLAKLGVPRSNIKVGNALEDVSYEFEEPAEVEIYFKVEDLGFSKVRIFAERNVMGKIIQKDFTIDFSKNENTIRRVFETLYKLFSLVDGKRVKLYSERLEGRLKFMNAFFKKYVGKTIKFDTTKMIDIGA